ncbi:3549_t:CDS:2, partial [Scutellospora calospora]
GPILNSDVLATMKEAYPTCKNLLETCYSTGTIEDCSNADNYCFDNYYLPFAENLNCSMDDIRAEIGSGPSEDYLNYLSKPEVLKAIVIIDHFLNFKINSPRTYLPELSEIVGKGIRTLLYHGDADADCDWIGGLNVSNSIKWNNQKNFNSAPFRDFIANNGTAGQIKSSNCLTYVKIHQAGHEVPFYQPQNSLIMFTRWIKGTL